MIYLAAPYTHADPEVRQLRHDEATRFAAELLVAGLPVFSPLTHSHAMERHGTKIEWQFWAEVDSAVLGRSATVLAVLMLDGWEASNGIKHEMELADAAGIGTYFICPEVPLPRIAATLDRLHQSRKREMAKRRTETADHADERG